MVSFQWPYPDLQHTSDKWEEAVRSQDVARAGAALTGQGQTFFNINGELKPGIRTPEIAKIMID